MTTFARVPFITELHPAVELDMVVVGVMVVVTGLLEATGVRDGSFTALLELERCSQRVELSFPDSLAGYVHENICHRVTAEGCLRNDSSTKRSVLDLHKLTRRD